jgi:hypothetical protein
MSQLGMHVSVGRQNRPHRGHTLPHSVEVQRLQSLVIVLHGMRVVVQEQLHHLFRLRGLKAAGTRTVEVLILLPDIGAVSISIRVLPLGRCPNRQQLAAAWVFSTSSGWLRTPCHRGRILQTCFNIYTQLQEYHETPDTYR